MATVVDIASLNTSDRTRAETKFQEGLVSWADDQFTRMKSGRARTEQQWYLNLAFFFGRQNVLLFDVSKGAGSASFIGRLFTPPAPYYRVRQVINKVRPTIRQEMAKLTSQRPSVTVVPASSEDRDVFAAAAGEELWDSTYRRKKFDVVLERTLFWSSITGNGFMKCWWDPNADDPDAIQNPNPLLREASGDFQFVQETPFHIFVPDLREVELENQPYLIHAQTRSQDYVMSRWGDRLYKPINFDVAAASDILDDSFINLIGAQELDRQRSVLIKECWIKPGQLHSLPEGAQFTIVGDQIVDGTPGWPYEHKLYPFAKIGAIPSGKFYCDSVITDLIPIQREINRTHSQIIEAKNKMAKPQLMGPKGSVDPAKITSEPGIFIEYEPGFQPPTPLPLQNLPSYVREELESLYRDFDDVSGQHEISKGDTPSGVTAGTAIAFLQEQDDSKLAAYFTSLEKAVEKIAHMSLCYIQQYWEIERIVKVVGSDGTFDAKTFKGADIRNNTDVEVESGSALPTSKAARQAFIFDLMKMGFVDPDEGLELMEIGGLGKLYERLKLDVREAQRENLRMASVTEEDTQRYAIISQMQTETAEDGVELEAPLIIPVNSWNNHPVHIVKHNDYRKSQAFESLPDFVKALFEAHVMKHELDMQMKVIESQQMGMQSPSIEGSPEEATASPQGEIPAGAELPEGV